MVVPTKRCDRLDKHEPHQWTEGKAFKRECPGRTHDKQNVRSRRAGHFRNPRTTD